MQTVKGAARLFGYIRPVEANLRVSELDCYKGVYCGMCRKLSSDFGPLARFTLSYDFTFAAMLFAAVNDDGVSFVPARCPYQPVRKQPHLSDCEALSFCSDVAMIMLDFKCVDNIEDDSSAARAKWRMARLLTAPAAKRAGLRRPKAMEIVSSAMERQRAVENSASPTLDECCYPSAAALGELFALMSEDAKKQRILNRLGAMLGRFVYLCDAVDDLEEDRKRGGFNPLFQYSPERFSELLSVTINEVCKAYCLLEPRVFQPILDNIIFEGLIDRAVRLCAGAQSGGKGGKPDAESI